jgi:hypothetical protein
MRKICFGKQKSGSLAHPTCQKTAFFSCLHEIAAWSQAPLRRYLEETGPAGCQCQTWTRTFDRLTDTAPLRELSRLLCECVCVCVCECVCVSVRAVPLRQRRFGGPITYLRARELERDAEEPTSNRLLLFRQFVHTVFAISPVGDCYCCCSAAEPDPFWLGGIWA